MLQVSHLGSKFGSRELVRVIMLWGIRLCAQLAQNLHHRLHRSRLCQLPRLVPSQPLDHLQA